MFACVEGGLSPRDTREAPRFTLSRWKASARLTRAIAIILLVVAVLAGSLFTGYVIDRERNRADDAAVVADINASMVHVLSVSRVNHVKFSRLAGKNCQTIQAALSPEDYITPYLRRVSFPHDGFLFCSTIFGADVSPLPSPLQPYGPKEQLVVTTDGVLAPGVPVMMFYERVGAGDGVLYVIEGSYIADLLARAKTSGAKRASLSARDGGTLTSENTWIQTPAWNGVPPAGANLAGGFAITIEPNAVTRRAALIMTETVTLVVVLSLVLAILMGYRAGFTPRQRLKRQVQSGLRRGEFFVVYQPVIDLVNGRWCGVEVLLRWRHPRFGIVMPGYFIRDVEESAVIAPLTQFVLSRSLTELSTGRFPHGFRVNINVAPHHIEMSCFPADILSMLQGRRGDGAFQLVLEITERGLLTHTGTVRSGIDLLRERGVQFSIDDFGSENSNLSMLQGFAFDYIKIDKQFIDHVAGRGQLLVETIVSLATKLGAQVIAEGVEEPEQHAALGRLGVTLAQGYFYQRPVDILELQRLFMIAQRSVVA